MNINKLSVEPNSGMHFGEAFDSVNPVIYLKAGAENGCGTEKSPYGDILDAIAKAKELGIAGAEHITLNFGAGDYSLSDTLTLRGEDFGGASIEMICEDNEKAVVGAWLPVTNFTETEVNGVKAWVADMPTLNGETVYSHQFFNGDYERLERPRYPEEGELRVEYVTDADRVKVSPSECGFHDERVKDSFYFFEGDIPENLTRLSDIQMCMYHFWNDERLTVKNIDYSTNLIEFEKQTHWINFSEGDRLGGRYFLDNVFECLKTPGKVYNDRESGKLYYIPYEDDDIETFKIYVSTIDTMLIIDGMNGSAERNSLTVKNIGFEGSDWKDVNRYVMQAAQEISASIQILNSDHISFKDCSFDHIGNYAVEIKKYVNNVLFDHCSVSDIGGGGIRITGANIVPVTDAVPYDITISDCTICGYGRVHKSAIGIFIQYAHDCNILHNEISDGYYSGISIGWIWGYNDHATSNILVEKNNIYNIGQGVLSDMGGIYLLGVQPGTKLIGNVIHDIDTYKQGYGGWAYYTDQGSSNILMEKNIGYNCSDSVYHHHFGSNNILRNNIFAFGERTLIRSSKGEEHVSFVLERNIFVNDKAPIYHSDGVGVKFQDDSNLLWDASDNGTVVRFDKSCAELSAEEQEYYDKFSKYGFLNNTVVANPLFADPFNGDFTLAENSPAWDIGFEPIDISDVGPRN